MIHYPDLYMVYMEDDGKYSCTVGNSGGLDEEDAYLHAYFKNVINSSLDRSLSVAIF